MNWALWPAKAWGSAQGWPSRFVQLASVFGICGMGAEAELSWPATRHRFSTVYLYGRSGSLMLGMPRSACFQSVAVKATAWATPLRASMAGFATSVHQV